jgi:uncharacterized protein YgbK (DUF1537 family)
MGEDTDAEERFGRLPPVWPQALLPEIRRRIAASGRTLVVLDDDPTGGQALHGLPVLAAWDVETLVREVDQSQAFFVLTNSRALREADAVALAGDIGWALRDVEQRCGRQIVVGYRGDSTLRGHFPAETDALFAGLTGAADARPTCVFAPYFAEGGRFTLDDTQYVMQGSRLVPAAQTEFARDPRFAYASSHLPTWLQERIGGRIRPADVVSVSIDDVRSGGPGAVAGKLRAVPEGGVVVLNAAADRDLEVFVTGLLDAEAEGRRFVYRTAASFVRVRAGIEPRPLLSAAELQAGAGPGLILAGSYVDRTTQQLQPLLAREDVHGIELNVKALIENQAAEVSRAAAAVSRALNGKRDVLLYSSRDLVRAASGDDFVAIGETITDAFAEVVRRLDTEPGYLIVKGGSTAHGVATKGLGMQRAVVLGQILGGVPVWRLGADTRFAGLPYVVFPGNVGGPDGLAQAVRTLRGCADAGHR